MKKNPYPNECQISDRSNCIYKNKPSSIDTSDNFCQNCGALLEEVSPPPPFPWKWLILSLVILLLAFAIWKYYTSPPPGGETPSSHEPTEAPCLNETPARKNVLDEIRRRGEVRIVVESNAPPFNYEENGQSKGFDYEMASAIARELGISRVKMLYADAEEYGIFPCYFNRGEADWFMGGYVATPDFDNLVSWSDSYYDKNGYCLIVKKGSGITDASNLRGKRVAVYDEDKAVDWVSERGGIPKRCIDTTDNGDWIQLELERFGMDAVIYDYPFAVSELSELDTDCSKFKFVQFNLNSLPYSIGIPKGNDDLLLEMNRAIKKIMDDEALYGGMIRSNISANHCEQRLSVPSDRKKHTVVRGETLSGIALAELGSVNKWQEIWEWNKSHIPNPHLIEIGDMILLEPPR